jgi:predicted amidophosphoribosyltransferase
MSHRRRVVADGIGSDASTRHASGARNRDSPAQVLAWTAVGEINIVSGGYVICPACSAKLTRFDGTCPRCGAALPERYAIRRGDRTHRVGFLRPLRVFASVVGRAAEVVRR